MKPARVRARTVRRWDPELGAWVSRIYGYQARTVDEPVGRVHNTYAEASADAQVHNQARTKQSLGAA